VPPIPSILQRRGVPVVAGLVVAVALLALLAAVTGGGSGDPADTGAPTVSAASDPTGGSGAAPDDPTPTGDGSTGTNGDGTPGSTPGGPPGSTPGSTPGGATGGAGAPPSTGAPSSSSVPSLAESVVVTVPQFPEGGARDEGDPVAPVLSESAALACANVEFAIDDWDAGNLGTFQIRIADAVARAEDAPEPTIAAALPQLRAVATATDPAPGITAFLEACVSQGYGI